MPDLDLTPTTLALFGVYIVLQFGWSIVRAINTNNMGERIKNEAVAAVTGMTKDALADARAARNELASERERRATLEGKFETLMKHAIEEKRRADSANMRLAQQDSALVQLSSEVRQLNTDMNAIRARLDQVEREKKELEVEKAKLEYKLTSRNSEYDKLMASVQERIDKAVADVRAELKAHYEARLEELQVEIRKRDEEIAKLKQLLEQSKEETPDEKATSQNPDSDQPVPADGLPDPSAGSNSGSHTGSSPDTGSASDTGTAGDTAGSAAE